MTEPREPSTGITVQATGEVQVAPDTGILRVGVEVEAETVAAARERAAEAADAVIQAVLTSGVPEADVQTAGLTIAPNYHYPQDGPRRLTGYTVANAVRVAVRDLASFPAVIDAAANAGGDSVRIDGVEFAVSDPSAAAAEARALAVANARAAAEQLATATGVSLGLPLMITELSAGWSPYPMQADMALKAGARAATPILAGTQPVQVAVTVRWAIS